jgi:RNA-directed DNA polymerase
MPKTYKNLYPRVCEFETLYQAHRQARQGGKRKRPEVAEFEHNLGENLLCLQAELQEGSYRPGPYRHFLVVERKERKISAAPYRDRVVHHALMNVIQPIFEARFIHDSYACRRGKGTHRALDRAQQFARRYPYALQCDVREFFPSIDHAILRALIARHVACPRTLWLVDRILESGAGVLADRYTPVYFPGDDLFAVYRPRGLPIGVRRESVLNDCSMQECMLNLLFHQQYPTRYRGEVTNRVKPAYNVSRSLKTAAEPVRRWQVC